MNPAKRILGLYESVLLSPEIGENGHAVTFLQMWGRVLGVSQTPDHTHEDEVSVGLIAVREELDLVKVRLAESNCPIDLYSPHIDRIRGISSPTLLHQEWPGHKRGLPAETLLAIKWSAWMLPDEEDSIPSGELEELSAELDAVEAALAACALSARMQMFVAGQIKLIRAALKIYPVLGKRPVDEALERCVGAITKEQRAISNELANGEPSAISTFSRFAGALGKVADVADKVDKIRRGFDSAAGMIKTVSDAISNFPQLPSP